MLLILILLIIRFLLYSITISAFNLKTINLLNKLIRNLTDFIKAIFYSKTLLISLNKFYFLLEVRCDLIIFKLLEFEMLLTKKYNKHLLDKFFLLDIKFS